MTASLRDVGRGSCLRALVLSTLFGLTAGDSPSLATRLDPIYRATASLSDSSLHVTLAVPPRDQQALPPWLPVRFLHWNMAGPESELNAWVDLSAPVGDHHLSTFPGNQDALFRAVGDGAQIELSTDQRIALVSDQDSVVVLGPTRKRIAAFPGISLGLEESHRAQSYGFVVRDPSSRTNTLVALSPDGPGDDLAVKELPWVEIPRILDPSEPTLYGIFGRSTVFSFDGTIVSPSIADTTRILDATHTPSGVVTATLFVDGGRHLAFIAWGLDGAATDLELVVWNYEQGDHIATPLPAELGRPVVQMWVPDTVSGSYYALGFGFTPYERSLLVIFRAVWD
jgi:hypothetical protein